MDDRRKIVNYFNSLPTNHFVPSLYIKKELQNQILKKKLDPVLLTKIETDKDLENNPHWIHFLVRYRAKEGKYWEKISNFIWMYLDQVINSLSFGKKTKQKKQGILRLLREQGIQNIPSEATYKELLQMLLKISVAEQLQQLHRIMIEKNKLEVQERASQLEKKFKRIEPKINKKKLDSQFLSSSQKKMFDSLKIWIPYLNQYVKLKKHIQPLLKKKTLGTSEKEQLLRKIKYMKTNIDLPTKEIFLQQIADWEKEISEKSLPASPVRGLEGQNYFKGFEKPIDIETDFKEDPILFKNRLLSFFEPHPKIATEYFETFVSLWRDGNLSDDLSDFAKQFYFALPPDQRSKINKKGIRISSPLRSVKPLIQPQSSSPNLSFILPQINALTSRIQKSRQKYETLRKAFKKQETYPQNLKTQQDLHKIIRVTFNFIQELKELQKDWKQIQSKYGTKLQKTVDSRFPQQTFKKPKEELKEKIQEMEKTLQKYKFYDFKIPMEEGGSNMSQVLNFIRELFVTQDPVFLKKLNYYLGKEFTYWEKKKFIFKDLDTLFKNFLLLFMDHREDPEVWTLLDKFVEGLSVPEKEKFQSIIMELQKELRIFSKLQEKYIPKTQSPNISSFRTQRQLFG